MTGYLCPPCFFRQAYSASITLRFPCAICKTKNSNKICSKCSQKNEVCQSCCSFIREGSSYSQKLEEIREHLKELIQTDEMYRALLDSLQTRTQIYLAANKSQMLQLCQNN